MQKIPTVFRRDPDDMRRLLPEVHPECAWVLEGEGTPTRKYDGTCVFYSGQGTWLARREVKPNKLPPVGYIQVDHDPVTGKSVGWQPIEDTGFYRWFTEAREYLESTWGLANEIGPYEPLPSGTYELVGPKINGNPERAKGHRLIRHASAEVLPDVTPRTFDTLKPYLLQIGDAGIEGIVWHHPDGRMAKLKVRDFR